jgi:hypothetical protein
LVKVLPSTTISRVHGIGSVGCTPARIRASAVTTFIVDPGAYCPKVAVL